MDPWCLSLFNTQKEWSNFSCRVEESDGACGNEKKNIKSKLLLFGPCTNLLKLRTHFWWNRRWVFIPCWHENPPWYFLSLLLCGGLLVIYQQWRFCWFPSNAVQHHYHTSSRTYSWITIWSCVHCSLWCRRRPQSFLKGRELSRSLPTYRAGSFKKHILSTR